MPRAKPNHPKSKEPEVTLVDLLKKVKTILEQQYIEDISELSKSLPKINKLLKETFIRKVPETEFQLKIEIVKLLKKLLAHKHAITSPLNSTQLQELTDFTYLICKSISQITQFQRELANYLGQYLIGFDDYVSIIKEGVFYRKNPDGTYSNIPAGTADIVIIVSDAEDKVVSQYIIECDGSSHTDAEKDKKRDTYCESHATEYSCLIHKDRRLDDFLKDINVQLKRIKKQVIALRPVENKRSETRPQKDTRDIIKSRQQKKSENSFISLQKKEEEGEGRGEGSESTEAKDESCNPTKYSKPPRKKLGPKPGPNRDPEEAVLEEAQAQARLDQERIDGLLSLAQDMKFGEFLESILTISKKEEKTILDQHLLKIALPYVLTLLKTGYQDSLLFNEELWSRLGKISTETITQSDRIHIADNIAKYIASSAAEPHASQETPNFWQLTEKILGTDLKSSVTQFNRYTDCLKCCCENDFSELFKHLFAEKGWEVKDKEFLLDLLQQCYAFGKNLEIVNILLEKIKELEIEVPPLCESSLIASMYRNLHLARLLLNAPGVKINERTSDNLTALMMETRNGHTEIVKSLLEYEGIEVNAKSSTGFTALTVAAESGHTEIVELLLRHKDINVNLNGPFNYNALMMATRSRHKEIVELLLRHKDINVNLKGLSDYTALMMAAESGHTEIAQLLLQHTGIDVNATNNDDFTALMLAAKSGHTEIVQLLLKHEGIDVNVQTKDGFTALRVAYLSNHTEIVELLLRHKDINVNLKGLSDYTALMMAAESGHTEIVQLLLQHTGIDVNVQNNDGSTALMMAAESGHTEIVKSLLQHTGIDVDLQTKDGCTALKMASKNRHKEIVESLLQYKGIDVNAQSNTGPAQALADTQIIERLTEQHEAPISHIAPAQSVQLKKPRTR